MTTFDGARRGATTAVAWFRVIAVAEALSWVGLLAGMYLKYLGEPRTEFGVKVFGPIHGAVFIAFVMAGLLLGVAHRWGVATWTLALLGSIVPLGSVIFLRWADRTGRTSRPEPGATGPSPGDGA